MMSDVAHGTLHLNSDGSLTYTSDAGFSGQDQFTYKTFDGTDYSQVATCVIDVNSQDDGGLTAKELQKIFDDLGVTLTNDEQLTLASIVKPTTKPQWRKDAEARIEQSRKSNLTLKVVNKNGMSVQNASVHITLRKKKFKFGGIINLKTFSGENPLPISKEKYREIFLKLFDGSGLDNGLKPKLRAGNESLLPGYFTWLKSVNLKSRGHLLIWPGGTHLSSTINALVEQIETEIDGNNDPTVITPLKNQLRTAVNQEISQWAKKWDVHQWDVVNEVLSNYRIQDILGENEIIEWFKLARANAVQPDCTLLINEFQLISAKSTSLSKTSYTKRRDTYKSQIQKLIDGKAPIGGIGFQSRFGFEHLPPTTLYERMQEFAVFNLPMVGTEFEVKDKDSFVPSETSSGTDDGGGHDDLFESSTDDGIICLGFPITIIN